MRQRVIVVGVDGSDLSRVAAAWAAREASRRELPLRVVHVAPSGTREAGRSRPRRPDAAADVVAAELTDRYPHLRPDTERLSGAAATELRSLSRNAEMIVVGLPGEREVGGCVAGAAVREVAAAAACPVVLVPGRLPRTQSAQRVAQVTVGVDARDPAAAAVGFAFDTARLRRARIRVLHAWSLPAAAAELPFGVFEEDRATWEDHEVQLLSDTVRPWREKYPDVPVLEDVVLFSPAEALIRNPGGADLVVVGRRRSGGNRLSPTAEALVRHGGCPVAVVPC